MKKHLLIILALLTIVLLMSCNEEVKDRTIHNNFEINIDEPDIQVTGPADNGNVFECTSNSFFFSNADILNGYNYSEDRLNWVKQIETLFGIKLKILCSYDITGVGAGGLRYQTTQYYNAVKEGIDNGDIVGLFGLQNLQTLKILKEDEYILPLNNYISESDNWNALPVEWRNAYAIDGKIWALPSTYIDSVTFRYIRGDWLKNLDLAKPKTIDEFYEIMHHFTYNDPDRDDVDNTFGSVFLDLYSISDLFSSFDARLNYCGEAVPAWNPNTDSWEDSMLKPEFAECLQFVKNCMDEKIMVNDLEKQSNNNFFEGYIGSIFGRDTRNILAEKYIKEYRPNNGEPRIEYITGLTHYIDKNITGYYTSYYYPKVLTKTSNNPASTLNIFINDFIADYDGFMLAHNGLQDVSYRMIDKFIVGNPIEEDGKYYPYQIPNLIGSTPFYDVSYASELHTPEVFDMWQTHRSRFQLTKGNNLCYKIPLEIINNNSSADMEKSLKSLASISNNIVLNIIQGNISYDEGLEQYRNIAKQLGIQEFLDEQNKLIGKTSDQHY